MLQTLFHKYGGIKTISVVVQNFYDKIQETPQLDKYFVNVNMPELIRHQTNFIAMVLGGPANQYDGRTLKAAHANLKITDADFNKVAELLQASLEEGGVEPADVATIMGIVGGTRADIVSA